MADKMKDEMKQLINTLLKWGTAEHCMDLYCEECPLYTPQKGSPCELLDKVSDKLKENGVKPINCSSVRCVECDQCKPVEPNGLNPMNVKTIGIPTTQGTTFERAIKVFGGYNQMIKTTEEMSELQKELCKALIGQEDRKHILEELTDVEIMLKQIKLIYNFTEDELVDMKALKIAKLETILQRHEKSVLEHVNEACKN